MQDNSNPLRTLFVLGSMYGGGSERQVLTLLQHLDRSRFLPILYLVYRDGDLLTEIPEDVPIFSFWDQHREPRLRYPGRIHQLQVSHLARTLREQSVDVVYDRTLVATLLAAPATRKAGVPRISVVADAPVADLAEQGRRFRFLKRRLLSRAYRSAFRTLTPGEDLRDQVLEFYKLPSDCVQVVRNPIDITRVQRLADSPSPFPDSRRFRIVTAGRLQPQKGLSCLLQALEILVHERSMQDIQLHILGQGPLESSLRQDCEERRIGQFVSFEGFQQNPFAFFGNANLFCLPSIHEGMPNVLLEAMACGIPVLATDCPTGPREILEDGHLGTLVPPSNASQLADAIADAVINPCDWKRRAELASSRLEDKYSLASALSTIQDVLGRACL